MGIKRSDVRTFVVALAAVAVGTNAPAIAHGVHAAFSHNSDKVDGIHAAKAGAANKNKKLIATDGTGKFPLSVIPKADADTLDGQDSSDFAASSHPHSGADISSGEVDETVIDPDIARDSEITNHNHDGAYSQLGHGHAGEDITSGTVAAARIDNTIARDSELPTAGSGLSNSGGVFSVNTGVIQSRVTGTCAGNQFVQGVLLGGGVTCATAASGSGDITDVTTAPGSGLSGGVSSGNANLSVDFLTTQRRVGGTCAAGQSIRVIDSGGNVTCEVDDNSGGDITDVTTAGGSGLIGGAPSGNANLSVDFNTAQRRVTGTCSPGSAIRIVDGLGTVQCETDDVGTGDITEVNTNPGLLGGAASGAITLTPNFTTAGGENGSATTVARGDHNHDGRYINASPGSPENASISIDGTLGTTGLLKTGSGTGTSQTPLLDGVVVRRINSTNPTAGQVVARATGSAGDASPVELQRDGTDGGMQIVVPGGTGSTSYSVACMGINEPGTPKGKFIADASASPVPVFSHLDNMVYFQCSIGSPFDGNRHETQVTLHRSTHLHNNWVGYVISTMNQ